MTNSGHSKLSRSDGKWLALKCWNAKRSKGIWIHARTMDT